ncbi:hypothetical protein M427DRAFT_42259 [Gonapodya prolifera JEL478]|uniref:Uncharacterized protein n=1 Tax=Gonapodya prolifera (strain JEL478) TaxID=1344416 RepID=A0A139AQL3_GONPJ|nr:hypothetical protein M427DRAFT_42259 [Gonapodya prolifera JEL478]|eukprot:KXS19047.1 hypothetical protein M427DRAFT_42259 [Gonapodya prolifera JEL478]
MTSSRLASALARGDRVVTSLTRAQMLLTIGAPPAHDDPTTEWLHGVHAERMVPHVGEALARLPDNVYISALVQDAHGLSQSCRAMFSLVDSDTARAPSLAARKTQVEDTLLAVLGPSAYLYSFACVAPLAAASLHSLGRDAVDLLMLPCVEAAAAVVDVCTAAAAVLEHGNWTHTKIERQHWRDGGIELVEDARARIYAPHGLAGDSSARAASHWHTARSAVRSATSFLESALGAPSRRRDTSLGDPLRPLDPAHPSYPVLVHPSNPPPSPYPLTRVRPDIMARLRASSVRLVNVMHVLVDRALAAAMAFSRVPAESQEHGIASAARLLGLEIQASSPWGSPSGSEGRSPQRENVGKSPSGRRSDHVPMIETRTTGHGNRADTARSRSRHRLPNPRMDHQITVDTLPVPAPVHAPVLAERPSMSSVPSHPSPAPSSVLLAPSHSSASTPPTGHRMPRASVSAPCVPALGPGTTTRRPPPLASWNARVPAREVALATAGDKGGTEVQKAALCEPAASGETLLGDENEGEPEPTPPTVPTPPAISAPDTAASTSASVHPTHTRDTSTIRLSCSASSLAPPSSTTSPPAVTFSTPASTSAPTSPPLPILAAPLSPPHSPETPALSRSLPRTPAPLSRSSTKLDLAPVEVVLVPMQLPPNVLEALARGALGSSGGAGAKPGGRARVRTGSTGVCREDKVAAMGVSWKDEVGTVMGKDRTRARGRSRTRTRTRTESGEKLLKTGSRVAPAWERAKALSPPAEVELTVIPMDSPPVADAAPHPALPDTTCAIELPPTPPSSSEDPSPASLGPPAIPLTLSRPASTPRGPRSPSHARGTVLKPTPAVPRPPRLQTTAVLLSRTCNMHLSWDVPGATTARPRGGVMAGVLGRQPGRGETRWRRVCAELVVSYDVGRAERAMRDGGGGGMPPLDAAEVQVWDVVKVATGRGWEDFVDRAVPPPLHAFPLQHALIDTPKSVSSTRDPAHLVRVRLVSGVDCVLEFTGDEEGEERAKWDKALRAVVDGLLRGWRRRGGATGGGGAAAQGLARVEGNSGGGGMVR